MEVIKFFTEHDIDYSLIDAGSDLYNTVCWAAIVKLSGTVNKVWRRIRFCCILVSLVVLGWAYYLLITKSDALKVLLVALVLGILSVVSYFPPVVYKYKLIKQGNRGLYECYRFIYDMELLPDCVVRLPSFCKIVPDMSLTLIEIGKRALCLNEATANFLKGRSGMNTVKV